MRPVMAFQAYANHIIRLALAALAAKLDFVTHTCLPPTYLTIRMAHKILKLSLPVFLTLGFPFCFFECCYPTKIPFLCMQSAGHVPRLNYSLW